MLPEIGHYALILAFAASVIQAPVLFFGARIGEAESGVFARRSAFLIFTLSLAAFAILMRAYAVSDFSVVNVFENSHTAKPFVYKLTGTWGNHEGSMLLWILVLAVFSAILAAQHRAIPPSLYRLTLGVQSLVIAAFLAFVLFTSNPFGRLDPVPTDGQGLNPLLQDPGLAIHPPFLYLGYVGFSIPFSFAVAALIRGRADAVWARLVRPWALAAWVFLTIGIALGSWWAYYELGWGGWWAWDPVENASFMPWLAGVALIHSVRVVERRDAMKSWAVLLAIITFSLSLVGTFLVRSGILTSVHAFAVDPTRGVFILMILAAAIGGSLTLFALRAGALKASGSFAPVSRESALVVNNVFLLSSCAIVFVGTFYPLFIDVLSGEKLSVGAPYFAIAFTPVAMATLFLAAAGTLLPWKTGSISAALFRLRYAGLAALAGALIVLVFVAREKLIGALSIALVLWLALGAVADVAARIKLLRAPLSESLRRARSLPRAAWGAAFAHFGLAVFALGVTGISIWQTDTILRMSPGDTTSVAGYDVTLVDVVQLDEANYLAERGEFAVAKGGDAFTMYAERRFYPVRQMQTSEAAVAGRGLHDFYIAISENATGAGWPVRILLNPFVALLWWGAGICALGGVVAATDRGRKPVRVRRRTPAAAPPAPQEGVATA
ncbi:MAG: heme lyase CcmF/NrfE family subunit [Pseudomonadota bacterium]